MKDVVAQVVQRRLGISGGKLGSIFNFFPHFHVNLLQRQHKQSAKQHWRICQKAVQSWCLFLFYLELLNAGHVVAEHAILQHGDGVTLTTNLLDLITCTIAEKGQIGAGVWQGCTNRILYYSWAQIQEWPLEFVVGNVAPYWRLVKLHNQIKQDWF